MAEQLLVRFSHAESCFVQVCAIMIFSLTLLLLRLHPAVFLHLAPCTLLQVPSSLTTSASHELADVLACLKTVNLQVLWFLFCPVWQVVTASAGCGPACTHDGLHYSNATYDAAMQIWANHLLLSISQQTSRKLMLG